MERHCRRATIARAARTALFLAPFGFGISPLSWGADEPPPRLRVQDSLGASVNNLGLQNSLDISWTWPLTASQSLLRKDSHVALGLSNATTPSYTRIGGWAEISPLSMLDLRVGAESTAYFGTFGSLMSFREYSDDFSSDARDAMKKSAGFGTAGRVYVSPTLKGKAGPVVAAIGADFEWWKSGASGPLFYEPARDTLLRAAGAGMVSTSSVLLYEHDRADGGKLLVGFNHAFTYVYDAPSNRVQKVGVLVVRQLTGRHVGLKRPRLVGSVFYYVADPSKRHQVGAALGIAFDVTH